MRRIAATNSLRENYIELHELLTSEIESNGFRNEHEAISFVSSMFSHVMGEVFLSEVSDIALDLYLKRDRERLMYKVRRLINALESDTKSDALGLGVDKRFISTYYSKNNVDTRKTLFDTLEDLNLDPLTSESRAKKALFSCLLDYLKSCIRDSKSTHYMEANRELAGSIVAVVATIAIIGYYLYSSKAHFLVWFK